MRKNVLRGIEYLQDIDPNWFWMIDLDRLDLSNCSECILGQYYGNYGDALDELGLNIKKAKKLGFTAGLWVEFSNLTKIWTQAIKVLRAGNN